MASLSVYFLLVCRHLRLLQTGYLCIVIKLMANTEALKGMYNSIHVENKEISKSNYPKQSARKQSSLEMYAEYSLVFFLSRFYVYDNVIALICHPFLVWSMASCGTAQASLHNPQHRTRISNSVQLLWRNQQFCGKSRADTMD